jgi:hypothetical protein
MQAAVVKGIDAACHGLWVAVHEQLHAAVARHALAHFVHGFELPRGVHMQ